jgi:aminocarboxymuconate-semialdehyde decarboxylase
MAECGASQIVIGTEYAVPWVKDPVDLILDTPTLSDADRIAIWVARPLDC